VTTPAGSRSSNGCARDCSVNCVSLANAVRGLGGGPTDIPSARFSLKLTDESLTELPPTLPVNPGAHHRREFDAVIDGSGIKPYRDALLTVRKLHTENIRWLKSAMGSAA